jgi:hypothetical protein
MKKIFAMACLSFCAAGAQAQWAVYDFRVEQGVKAMVDAVRGQGQAQTAIQAKAVEQTTAAVVRAQSNAARQQIDRDYIVTDACGTIAGTQGMSDVNRINNPAAYRSGRNGGGGIGTPRGASPSMTKALEVALGDKPPPAIEAQASTAIEGACATFVDVNSLRGQSCKNADVKSVASGAGLEPDADIKATTILYGALRKGEAPRKKFTIDPDQRQVEPEFFAIQALRRNLNTPFEARQLSSQELRTDAGRQYTVMKDAYDARMSVADAPFMSIVAGRAPNLPTIKMVEQLLSSPVHAGYTQVYLEANGLKDWKTKGISRDEITNLEVERRHMNIDWHANIASQPGDPIMKEMIAMMAFNQTQDWEMRLQMREMSLVLGQILATLNRMEMTPQLNALHAAATRPGR